MFEFIELTRECGYIDCPAKIGVYRPGGGNDVYLIDSGSDKDAGRKVRQMLDKNGWTLRGILNTHSHADHVGGNKYLQAQTGCKVFSGGIEAAVTAHTLLEPAGLYGGCPHRELRHKFLMAQESDVSPLTDPGFPKEVEVIPLPGHSFDMVGYRAPDGVVFLGDCVNSEATLEKYGIGYLFDVQAALDTLDRVEAMQAKLFVPSHAGVCEDIAPLARLNREKMLEAGERILALLGEPQGFDALLAGVFERYGLTMTVQQHALIGSTVRSYLSWHKDAGRVQIVMEDNVMKWRAASGD